MSRLHAALVLAGVCVHVAACDDPVPGPVGGVVFTIRTSAAAPGSKFAEAKEIRIAYDRVVSVSGRGQTVLDTQPRVVTLLDTESDVLVAQYQVPVGELGQIRLFATKVTVVLENGNEVELEPDTSDLPSWGNTGWKVVPESGTPFQVVQDELTGVRGLFDFDKCLVRPGNASTSAPAKWKMKPTLPAEPFDPNPARQGPGLLVDHVTLVAKPGATAAQVQALADGVSATVVRVPHGSSWYYAYPVRTPTPYGLGWTQSPS